MNGRDGCRNVDERDIFTLERFVRELLASFSWIRDHMSLQPLLDAAAPIPLHAFAAMAGFALGVVQLAAPKGTLSHRVMGWLWVLLLAITAISSFWIHGDSYRLWRDWSPIHLLSILTPIMLVVGVLHARRHRVRAHASRWCRSSLARW